MLSHFCDVELNYRWELFLQNLCDKELLSVYRSLFHSTTERLKIEGFGPFPEGSLFSIALLAIFMNEKYFPEPFKFDPMRFIEYGVDGSLKLKNDRNLIPFSVGARRCPGEHLAVDELLHFTLAMLPNFEFRKIVVK